MPISIPCERYHDGLGQVMTETIEQAMRGLPVQRPPERLLIAMSRSSGRDESET